MAASRREDGGNLPTGCSPVTDSKHKQIRRVLFVDQTSALGGAELSLLDIVKQRGVTDRVLLFQDGEFARLLRDVGTEVLITANQEDQYEVRKNSNILQWLRVSGFMKRNIEAVRRAADGCEVIYANTPKAFVVSALASVGTKKPLIYHLRDIVSSDHFSWINRQALVRLARLSKATVIANSLATARAFAQAGADEKRISVVYNGIDSTPFDIARADSEQCKARVLRGLKKKIGPEAKIVGVFGRLARWKGQDVAIRAVKKLPNVHMLLVGTALFGESDYVQELNSLVSNWDLDDRIHFLGFRGDVATVMQACDVVVHCSSSPEPFGRVIVEAMLSKRPVVASRAGGAPEIIKEGESGRMFEPESVDELSTCIEGLLEAKDARAMVEAAYLEAKNRFSVSRSVDSINQIIEAVCSIARGGSILPLRPSSMPESKILFVDQTAQLGGAELCLLDIIRHRNSKSQRNSLDKAFLFENGKLEQILRAEGIEVSVQSLSGFGRKLHKESGAIRKFFGIVDVLRLARSVAKCASAADLIVANTPKALVIASLAKLISRRPLVYHLHDILSSAHFSYSNIRLLVFLANRFASRVIANSQATLDAFRASGGRTPASVCYNGFDITPFDRCIANNPSLTAELRSKLGVADDASIIGVFGRLAPWKGQHIAIEAIRSVPNAHLVIVGEALFGEEDYKSKLFELASSMELHERIHFLGFHADIAPIMQAVDVVVHCSTAPEPFGRVIVEAMLSQKPLIASNAGGVREIVSHGSTGVLVTPDDPAALSAAIAGLLADPNQMRMVASVARSRARLEFCQDKIVQQYEQVIRGVATLGA